MADMLDLSHTLNPWDAGAWHGVTKDLKDGPPGELIEFNNDWIVTEIIHLAETEPDCDDGQVAAVVRIADGRYMTWMTSWGPTGSGFSEDAYGGDAEVLLHPSLDSALRFGLNDHWRRTFGVELS